jgi:hypothetical protein
MKKFNLLFLSIILVALMVSACGPTTGPTATTSPTTVQTGEAVRTGFGVVTSIAKSTDATSKENGLAQVDSTVVALTLGEDGKITNCVIDAIQTKINFTNKGAITTPLDTEFKSKQALGSEYGMGKVSSIKKEWNQQADAFAQYVIGKTVDEVKGIAVNDEGVSTEPDLTSTVTIHVGDFIKAIEKAASNAKDMGAKAGDKLGLGIKTTISKSKAAGNEDGTAQAYSNYAVTTTDSSGKITSCIIDGSQSDVKFSKAGKITSDLNAAPKTKVELGDDYGMKQASGIGKEWFEQAQAFADYVMGKTISEVKGISLDEEGHATEADLKSSVTISLGDYIEVIDKSVSNAR